MINRKHNTQTMPPVYLINLDRSTERLQKSRALLEKHNILFERIPAICGRSLSEDSCLEHYCPDLNKARYYYNLTPAQIGCFLSHREAWRRIAEGDADYGIVLEDDFLVEGDVHKAFATLDGLTHEWDLIKLSAYANRTRPIAKQFAINDEFNLVVHKKPMSGGAATAISKKGAQKLYASTAKFGRPCDTEIQHFWEHGITVLSLMPYPFAQDVTCDSTIACSKKSKDDRRPLRRLSQQCYQYLRNKSEVSKQLRNLALQLHTE